jgi:dihydrofolate reductase
MDPLRISLVVAADRKRGIGMGGAIPWKLRGDMKYFRELTTCPDAPAVHARYRLDTGHRDKRRFAWDKLPVALGPSTRLPVPGPSNRNAVLMGRKTWDSLPPSFRPLPNRLNGVLSRSLPAGDHGTHRVWPSLEAALRDLAADTALANVYVVGGGEIYAQAIARPECRRVYLTSLEADFPCDAFFPDPGPAFAETAVSPEVEENGLVYRYRLLERV